MSGTFDKKSLSGAERRLERELKEKKDKKKVRITAAIVIAVLVLLFAAALFINSKYIRRTMTAVSIAGVNFTAAEYDYYFNSAYYEYQTSIYQNDPDNAASLLPSSGTPLNRQIFDDTTGRTWADLFSDNAISKMSEIAKFYSAAVAAGYTLPDSDREKHEEELDLIKEEAEAYKQSLDEYLQYAYGINMNEKVIRRIIEVAGLADSYSKHVRDSFEYTPEQLVSYYSDNKDMLDIYTYRYMYVTIEEPLQEDYETTDEYNAAKDAALADAIEKAGVIASDIKSEQDFIDAAREYNPETYADDDSTLRLYSGDLLGDAYGPWLRDAARKTGDVTTSEYTAGCYVVYYISRSDNDYNMTSMRQLLIDHDEVNETDYPDDPEGYLAALEEADKKSKDLAEFALSLFENGGATEEKLIELMPDYSVDTTEGGLYENIFKASSISGMVPEIDEWLFDPVRKTGDYELILSEAYGYHLVYFMGFGDRYCDYLADNGLRTADYNDWVLSLGTPEVQKHWAYALRTQ